MAARLTMATAGALRPWFPSLDTSDARIATSGPVCWFVRSALRQGAMTLGSRIYFGRSAYEPSRPESLALLAHELKHVEQYRRYGAPGFLARYLWRLALNGFRYSHDLPLEKEAYAIQERVREALGER